MLKVLHITAHLGGGVGRVLFNYLARARRQEHRLLCLDAVGPATRTRAAEVGAPLADDLGRDLAAVGRAVEAAEVVVLHWWNHPLVYQLLMNGRWPASRLLLWSHVSGLAAPQSFSPELPAFPDLFAVASPASFRGAAVAARDEAWRRDRLRLLFSSAGVDLAAGVRPRPHEGFAVGYLGTVDYGKMHPRFIELCLAAALPRARFPVAGGPDEDRLRRDAAARNAASYFDILGPIDDVPGFLAGLDVFGYPLNPRHYGTGEQVLIEALAAGLPSVVLAGGAEEFVVEHERTGLVARDEADYPRCLARLHEDGGLARRLGREARRRAAERFAVEQTVAALEALYGELMDSPKKERAWPGRAGLYTPAEFFLASQNELRPVFETLASGPLSETARAALGELSFSRTRGSVFHYHDFFPEDERLKTWRDLLAAAAV